MNCFFLPVFMFDISHIMLFWMFGDVCKFAFYILFSILLSLFSLIPLRHCRKKYNGKDGGSARDSRDKDKERKKSDKNEKNEKSDKELEDRSDLRGFWLIHLIPSNLVHLPRTLWFSSPLPFSPSCGFGFRRKGERRRRRRSYVLSTKFITVERNKGFHRLLNC